MSVHPVDFLKGDHPLFSPERCINRKQRRVVCSRCSEICPTGVFSMKSGQQVDWTRCVDCGICVANCPTRCFSHSGTAKKRLYEECDRQKPFVFACRKNENRADVRVRCLAALPWELLAVCAMRDGIALRMDLCGTCGESARKACLEENLESLRAFFGDRQERVRILTEAEKTESAETEEPEKRLTRRGLLAGLGQSAAGIVLRAASERLPFSEDAEEDGLLYRRLLTAAVQRETEEDPNRRYTVSLPWFNVQCSACGICEKICPNQAIRIVREESGNSLICLTPWKCSACGLCVRLCLKGGLSGMHGVRVPCLTEVPLVRIERSTPHD